MKDTYQSTAPKKAGSTSSRLTTITTVVQVGQFYFSNNGKILTEDEVDIILENSVSDTRPLPNFVE